MHARTRARFVPLIRRAIENCALFPLEKIYNVIAFYGWPNTTNGVSFLVECTGNLFFFFHRSNLAAVYAYRVNLRVL